MRKIQTLEYPRKVSPELLEEGDLITVTLPKSAGITMTKHGRIYRRVDHGNLRQYLTIEGAVILTWQPDQKPKYTVTLHERIPYKEEPLFDLERLG